MKTVEILREYSKASRHAWDAQNSKYQLDTLANEIEHSDDVSEQDAREIRDSIGICPDGEGHWVSECDWYCGNLEEI